MLADQAKVDIVYVELVEALVALSAAAVSWERLKLFDIAIAF